MTGRGGRQRARATAPVTRGLRTPDDCGRTSARPCPDTVGTDAFSHGDTPGTETHPAARQPVTLTIIVPPRIALFGTTGAATHAGQPVRPRVRRAGGTPGEQVAKCRRGVAADAHGEIGFESERHGFATRRLPAAGVVVVRRRSGVDQRLAASAIWRY